MPISVAPYAAQTDCGLGTHLTVINKETVKGKDANPLEHRLGARLPP